MKVRLSSGHIGEFDKQFISDSIIKESALIEKLNGHKRATQKEADSIAIEVEKLLKEHTIDYLSSPLIREIACTVLLKKDMEEVRRIYTRVGLPVYDLFNIITNPEIENANLVDNAETAHKYVADKVMKEAALVLLSRHVTEAHLSGDIHIHDLEYFMTRTFCADWDIRNFFFYGLDSSGINKTNVAGPAKNAEVAILHAAKVLGSAQTNFSVDASEDVIISSKDVIKTEKIGNVVDNLMKNKVTIPIPEINGEYLDISNLGIQSIAFNPNTYKNEMKIINKVIRHECIDDLFEITTKSGKSVKTTGSHSVFKFINGIPCEVPVCDLKQNDELVVPSLLPSSNPIEEINLITAFSNIDKEIIKNVFVVGSGYKINKSNKNVSDWMRRDSIPLNYIIENSINIDSKHCSLRNARSNKKIPGYISLTPELYRLLGYFTSEGHITQCCDVNYVGFSFGIEKKSECIKDTKNILKSIFGLDSQETQPNTSTVQVIVDSKLLCIILKYVFNTGVNAKEKSIPTYVLNASKENKIQFLRGYFCDGHSRRREITFKTVSRKLASDISYLLLQLGIKSVMDIGISKEREFDNHILPESTYYQTSIYGRESLELLTPILGDRNNLDEYKTNYIFPNKENKIIIGDLCSDKVISIKKVKPTGKYVYDFSINGYENFVGGNGGIVLHNSGGQGFYNFLTFVSPYLKGRSEKEIRQLMQMFLYEIAQTMVARGAQVVFSSIQLTPGVPNLWKDKPAVYAGEVHQDEPYGNFEKEVRIAFKVLMELMIEGDYNGKPFNFPKPEIGFMKEFLVSHEQDQFYGTEIPTYDELYELVFKLTAKFGTPYFDNMIPAYRNHGEESIECYQCVKGDTKIMINSKNGVEITDAETIFNEYATEKCDGWNTVLPDVYIAGDGKWNKVKKLLRKKDKGIRVKTTSSKILETTPDHPFIIKGIIKTAKELKKGDIISVPKSLPTPTSIVDLHEDVAWLIGYWIGNGCLRDGRKNPNQTIFITNSNKNHAEVIETIVKKHFKYSNIGKYKRSRADGIQVQINSEELYKLLTQLELKNGACEKSIPSLIFNTSTETKKSFIKGLLDSDGYVSESNVRLIQFSSVSHELAIGLQWLFKTIGIDVDVYKYERESTNYSTHPKPIYRVTTMNASNSYNASKILGLNYNKPSRVIDTTYRITEITPIEEESYYYDWELDNDHLFVSGNLVLTHNCCAYSFSTDKQKDSKFTDKLYFKDHIGFSMGAWQVVTVNCPRIAYKSSTPDEYVKNWSDLVDLTIDVFKEKKKFIDIQLSHNRIPFAQQKPKNHHHQSKYSLVDFDELVWVVGIVGIDDVVRHFTGKSMHESIESFELAQYLCLEMKRVVEEKSVSSGMKLVFSRTPAETTAQRFAVADVINPLYSESAKKIVSGDLGTALQLINNSKNLPIYYTNGTHVPVSAPCTLIDRIRIEEDFFDILAGGNIHHIFISEWNSDSKGLKEFGMNIIKNSKIGYFAFTKVLTACNDCFHVEQGKQTNCSQCGSTKIDYISRITGYLSNLKSWNAAKQEEFRNRREYSLMRQ